MPLSEFVQDVVGQFRAKLLDLSGRNSLVSFKHRERSNRQIRIVDITPNTAFQMLEGDKPIAIKELPLPHSEPEDEQSAEFASALAEAKTNDPLYLDAMKGLGDPPPVKPAMLAETELRDRLRAQLNMPPIVREKLISREEQAAKLRINPSVELKTGPTRRRTRGQARIFQTLYYPEELERRLSGVYEQSRLSVSETGVNTLFAAFGFLEWYEDDNSSEPLYSPILLYPLELSREIKEGKYIYSVLSRGEDVSENVCLQERLKHDFDFVPLILGEEEDPEAYCERLRQLISGKHGWRVHSNLTIGFFSFAKLAMYHDLNPAGLTHLEEESVLSRVVMGSDSGDPVFAHDYEIDAPEFRDKIRAMIQDADSSQLSAVIDILNGKSIVIEGPPGTGKSQTITNIIAAALEDDRSVLFIAEKKAALDVVKKRLDDAGLGDFCLELHSNKTRKTDVLKSLNERLQRRRLPPRAGALDSLLADQDRIRSTLRDYVEILNSAYGELGITLHQIAWRFLRLKHDFPELPPRIFSLVIDRCETVSSTAFESNVSALRTLERHHAANLAEFPHIFEHPWFGFSNPEHTPADSENMLLLCGNTVPRVKALIQAARSVPIIGDELACASVRGLRQILSLVLSKSDLSKRKISNILAERLANAELRESAASAVRETQELWNLENSIRSRIGGRAPDLLTAIDVSRAIAEAIRLGLQRCRVSELQTAISDGQAEHKVKEEIFQFAQNLAVRARFEGVLTATAGDALIRAAKLLDEDGRRLLNFRSPAVIAEDAPSRLKKAKDRLNNLRAERERQQANFQLEAAPDLEIVRKAAALLRGSTFWSWFSPKFWQSRKFYFSIATNDERVPSREMANRLASLAKFLDGQSAMANDSELKALCGLHFEGIDSDLERVSQAVTWASNVRTQLVAFDDLAAQLRQKLFTSSPEELAPLGAMSAHPRFPMMAEGMTRLLHDPQKRLSETVSESLERKEAIRRLAASVSEFNLPPNITLESMRSLEGLLARRDSLLEEMRGRQEKLDAALYGHLPLTAANIDIVSRTIGYADEVQGAGLPLTLAEALLRPDGQESFERVLKALPTLLNPLSSLESDIGLLDSMRPAVTNGEGHQDAFAPMADLPLPAVALKLEALLEHSTLLHPLTDYLKSEAVVTGLGLRSILQAFHSENSRPSNLDIAYEIALCGSLLRRATLQYPELGRSVGFEFDELRSRFRRADDQIVDLHRRKLQFKLGSRNIPGGISEGKASELTDLGLIKREIAKQTKHLPIRKLLSRAGLAVKRMKPCFMMSPLSVSQFLARDFTFDLVVMDEASQLRPEEALGAIARAKQVVVVGDPKQLPPTNFFNFTDNAVPATDDAADFDLPQESIMELSLRALRARRLKWHYRSKHESLIAFSNHAFYDRDLIVFPSPHHHHDSLGIRHVAVNGIYDKRRNVIEAQSVVEAAIVFMAEHPGRSLGIVAMNQEQRDVISDLLDDKARRDLVVQNYLAKWEGTLEPFFVKNLENVQGDERDVIFISTVYGKDSNGNLFQRFGPINGAMGHRRLNVLFTRAKCQMTIFTSLDDERLIVDNRSSAGLRALKQFLTYARTGRLESAPDVDNERQPDSEFEVLVMSELRQRGYQVSPQVGVAGYFIDLAVHHPNVPGNFILGIECDGASFHSAKSARDRDKTRQEVLENLGWSIHRIWSTDWFQHADRELNRLLAKLPPVVQ